MNKPIIYYVCGYQSSSQHSAKFAYLQQHLAPHYKLLPLDYPQSYDPKLCLDYFNAYIQQYTASAFMGSSLGGFWALQLANQHHKPAILLNPCCRPSAFATRFRQHAAIFHTFAQLEQCPLNDCLPRLALLAIDDTILNYRHTLQQLPASTHYIIYQEGGHLLQSKLPLITAASRAFLQTML